LIIDDDANYSCLLLVAFQEAHVENPIAVINDGWKAVNHLKSLAAGSLSHLGNTPALVLLDLRMPKVSGLEVLRWIRSEPGLAGVPVMVFTGMEAGDEQAQAMELGATSFHVKPFSYRELVQQVASIRDCYLEPQQLAKAA
jgi:DNA-binding response OmpR family regulator